MSAVRASRIFVRYAAATIFSLTFFVAPGLADILSDLRSGAITPEAFLTQLLSSPEKASPALLDGIQNDPALRNKLGHILERGVELVLLKESSAAGIAQKKLAQQLLPRGDPSRARIERLFFLSEQLEGLAPRGDLEGTEKLLPGAVSAAERNLIERAAARLRIKLAREYLKTSDPIKSLFLLGKIPPEMRGESGNQLVSESIIAIQRQPESSAAGFDGDTIELLRTVDTADIGLQTAIADLFSRELLRAVERGEIKVVLRLFEEILKRRSDPSEANNNLRYKIALHAKTPEVVSFARSRLKEIPLSLPKKARLLFSGFYGYSIFAFFFLALVLLAVVFPIVARQRSRIPREVEPEPRKKRSGPGYMRLSETTDEYTELLALFGLDDRATEVEIKKAYRQAMKELHPDRQKDDADVEAFQQLQVAYDRIMEIRGSWFGRR